MNETIANQHAIFILGVLVGIFAGFFLMAFIAGARRANADHDRIMREQYLIDTLQKIAKMPGLDSARLAARTLEKVYGEEE